jgi:hypothetical protein
MSKNIDPTSEAKKISVIHSNIENWLKSVEGLTKDLKDLEAVKAKFKTKMNQIKNKYKSEKQKKDQNPENDEKRSEEKPEENIEGKAKIENEKSNNK